MYSNLFKKEITNHTMLDIFVCVNWNDIHMVYPPASTKSLGLQRCATMSRLEHFFFPGNIFFFYSLYIFKCHVKLEMFQMNLPRLPDQIKDLNHLLFQNWCVNVWGGGRERETHLGYCTRRAQNVFHSNNYALNKSIFGVWRHQLNLPPSKQLR